MSIILYTVLESLDMILAGADWIRMDRRGHIFNDYSYLFSI